jgi:hypothetical protein
MLNAESGPRFKSLRIRNTACVYGTFLIKTEVCCSEGAECRSLVYQAAISTCVLGKRTLVILGGGR